MESQVASGKNGVDQKPFHKGYLVTGKESSRAWDGGGSDGLLHLIILYACSLLIRDQHGVSLGQAYVGFLLGPEIGDVWVVVANYCCFFFSFPSGNYDNCSVNTC